MDMTLVLVISLLFLGAIIWLTTFNNKNKYMTVLLFCVILLGGLALYGCGYVQVMDTGAGSAQNRASNLFVAAMKSTTAAIKMFVGGNAFSDIEEAEIMQNAVAYVAFWMLHFVALAFSAKAILATFGAGMLRYIRSVTIRRGPLAVIYGVNAQSVAFGATLRENAGYSIVYVDAKPEQQYIAVINDRVEGLTFSDQNALEVNRKFLKNIGAFRHDRKLVLYTLCEDESANVTYARKWSECLKEVRKIPKKNVSLSMLANMELDYGNMLQAAQEEPYGFGSVMIQDSGYLVARQLIRHYPPCNYVEFDHEKCVAKSDFHAMIIGFGKIGQAVLKELVMNAQFEGSRFKITVVDPDCERKMGYIDLTSRALFEKYDIEIKKEYAGDVNFYRRLLDSDDIRYIAVCIKNAAKNNAIASDIQALLKQGGKDAVLLQCNEDSVICNDLLQEKVSILPVYTTHTLDIARADKKAMALHYIYSTQNAGAEENGSSKENAEEVLECWAQAGYMDKMSSRASADFSDAFLTIAGASPEEFKDLSEERLENLAKTEHLRWCAFFCTMGYETMSEEEFTKRGERYRAECKKSGKSSVKIQRDKEKKLHACLTDWDNLDALSEKYSAYTGKNKNYKQDDKNNVLIHGRNYDMIT